MSRQKMRKNDYDNNVVAFSSALSEERKREDKALQYFVSLHCAAIARNARDSVGMTQAELAAKIGVDQSRVSQLESAKSEPMLSTLVKIVDACNGELYLAYRDKAASRSEDDTKATLRINLHPQRAPKNYR